MGQRKRATKSELAARNKQAFDEIIGDPYAYPEPLNGLYYTLKTKSSITAAVISEQGQSKSPVNKAKPSSVDFFVDVEAAVRDGLEAFFGINTLDAFVSTYITEDGSQDAFSQNERAGVEQAIGRLFVARKISPVNRYFTTVKH